MKTLKTCIMAFVILSFAAGCKKEEQKNESAVQEAAAEPEIQVVADMVVKKDDAFEIFYTEDESLDFVPQKKVRVEVKGKDASQKIVFTLPDNVHLGNLRIDFGDNQQQGDMVINSLVLKYHDKELELNAADFFTHFQPTGYIEANAKNFSFKGVKVDDVYDPFFYGNTTLMQVLKQFNQEK